MITHNSKSANATNHADAFNTIENNKQNNTDNLKDDNSFNNKVNRHIRSFVKRAGRISTAQLKALTLLSKDYVLPYSLEPINWENTFKNSAPLILEIGFGMGSSTAHIACAQPDKNFIATEVHAPGVGALLQRIDKQKINNIRIIQHDAVEVLKTMIPHNSLAGIHIFFPDPWHKKRHHKRRLIQAELVELLVSRLANTGYIHCATDWANYAENILKVLSANSQLKNMAIDYCQKPDYRPLTKFEERGLKLGHQIFDLIFHANKIIE